MMTRLLIAGCATLLVVGCGTSTAAGSGSTGLDTAAASVAASPTTAGSIGSVAPDAVGPSASSSVTAPAAEVAEPLPATFQFAVDTIDGQSFDSRILTTQPTVLWFWASWCTICARESSTVAALSDHLAGSGVQVMGVAGLGSPMAEARPWADQHSVGALTHLFDADGSLFRRFEVIQQPSFAFVHPDGSFETVTGVVPLDELITRSKAL